MHFCRKLLSFGHHENLDTMFPYVPVICLDIDWVFYCGTQ